MSEEEEGEIGEEDFASPQGAAYEPGTEKCTLTKHHAKISRRKSNRETRQAKA